MSTPSEDKSERVAKDESSPNPTINSRLKLSPLDQNLINFFKKQRESLEESEDMEQDRDEEESHTQQRKTPGTFKEEFDFDDETVQHDSNSDNKRELMAVKNEAEVDSESTKTTSNMDGAGEGGSAKATSKNDNFEKGHFTKIASHNEASQEEEEEANSTQIASDYEVSEEHIEWVDDRHQLYTVSSTRVSALSPYCQIMVKPSWESSDLYRTKRGPWLHLVLKETSYKVHREVILSKLPNLPSIYFDLTDEEEEEHRLDESLHDVNLMLYWVYHGTMPPRVEIKRADKGVGMTWDPYEIMKFALKLRAEEFLNCIHKVFVSR